MIVQRVVWKVKVGAEDQIVEMLRPYLRDEKSPLRRLYRPRVSLGSSTFGVIVGEFEFEDLGALQRAWDQWSASEDAAEFLPKWNELVESGGGSEVWELVE